MPIYMGIEGSHVREMFIYLFNFNLLISTIVINDEAIIVISWVEEGIIVSPSL